MIKYILLCAVVKHWRQARTSIPSRTQRENMTADGGGDYDDNDKYDDGLDAIRVLLMQVSPGSGIYTA